MSGRSKLNKPLAARGKQLYFCYQTKNHGRRVQNASQRACQAIIGAYGFVLEGVTDNAKMNEGPLDLFSYYKDDNEACEEVHMVHCKWSGNIFVESENPQSMIR